MTTHNSFIRTTAVAVVALTGVWQPGSDAWGADGKEEPWYTAWLQVAADSSVPIRDTKPSLHWRTDMGTLYRGDTTDQGLGAFQDGILPKAAGFPIPEWMYDWWSHGAGAGKSVYSSTTRDQSLAQRFAKEWVYEIKAPHGIDQDASGGAVSEQEISFPGGVKREFIRQACKKDNLADCEANQNYREPTGHESPLEVAAVSIEWSRITPPEGLAWVKSKESLWAVGSQTINPVQGAAALAQGLRGRSSLPPILRWASQPESPYIQSVVVAFRDYSEAKVWAVVEAQNGGWVYEVRPNSVAVDLSGRNTGAREGAFAFIGGIKGGLLMNARRFEKGVGEPVECIGIEKEACRLDNRHQ
ncbi:hypothetical protein [Pseudomonas sp. B21-010]|uniref:scabin-related ADP-ribosyltransferase n=1 Tax=Pseudomonas sp. B21-010 TaxID=2895471 RepID=UPI00216071C4|nr:hypothetical protein [Pseudomonas sp. B21-010]UVM60338.1 hypothetical protein LOY50_22790 [Pseudomonas sp. B21-010]